MITDLEDYYCKLRLNNAKKPKHYWERKPQQCRCGCKIRVFIKKQPICLDSLIEILNKIGYSIEKNYVKGKKK